MTRYSEKFQRGPGQGRRFRRARVELMPLIDVMFLLVAFFMVISISMVMQQGIFVDLSPAETADTSLNEPDQFVISVAADGSFYLNKEEIALPSLAERLREAAIKSDKTSVVINADENTQHKNVIHVLDLVRRSHLQNVIFSVKPRE